MNISVIIPTYNRPDNLKECLANLTAQTLVRKFYEIIVVDDGSSTNLEPLVKQSLENSGVKYFFIKQVNSGPAEARNKGVLAATGEVVLFIGDDIMASDNFLAEHYNFHLKNPNDDMATLGFTTWSKDIKISDFMVWLEASSFQFGYYALKPGQAAGHNYFYTSNISLKKRFMLNYGMFNSAFRYAAFEDVELGYRLIKAGLKLIYNPSAIAYHKHEVNIKDSIKRMEIVGKSAKVFTGLHPELTGELSLKSRRRLKGKVKSFLIIFLHYFAAISNCHRLDSYYWKNIMLASYMKGYDLAGGQYDK